jgi:hypothetical protein
MDFSLTTVFVLPVGNTLPTTGGTAALTAGQFGIFKDDTRTIANAGNISTANYIQFFQGRDASLSIGSKPSDKIKASKVKSWYKVTGSATAANEIWQVSNWTAKCGEDVTLTVRGHSSYLDTISFNGLTRSITVTAPCCDCGSDPCDTVDVPTLLNLFIQNLAQQDLAQVGPNALKMDTFFTFTILGTGSSSILQIESKPLTKYGVPCDIAADPYEFDRIWFRVYVTKGPATTVDFEVFDPCDVVATAEVTQRSDFPRLTSTEVRQMEIDYYSYQSPFKHLYRMAGYNQYYEGYVVDGQVYDQYLIQFDELTADSSWTSNLKEDERVIFYVPQGQGATIETILTAYLGAPIDESGATVTTTTTTSTSSTSTTTTTSTLIP